MKNLILAGVIGSIVFVGLACGHQKKAEPSQVQNAIEQRNNQLKEYGF